MAQETNGKYSRKHFLAGQQVGMTSSVSFPRTQQEVIAGRNESRRNRQIYGCAETRPRATHQIYWVLFPSRINQSRLDPIRVTEMSVTQRGFVPRFFLTPEVANFGIQRPWTGGSRDRTHFSNNSKTKTFPSPRDYVLFEVSSGKSLTTPPSSEKQRVKALEHRIACRIKRLE